MLEALKLIAVAVIVLGLSRGVRYFSADAVAHRHVVAVLPGVVADPELSEVQLTVPSSGPDAHAVVVSGYVPSEDALARLEGIVRNGASRARIVMRVTVIEPLMWELLATPRDSGVNADLDFALEELKRRWKELGLDEVTTDPVEPEESPSIEQPNSEQTNEPP